MAVEETQNDSGINIPRIVLALIKLIHVSLSNIEDGSSARGQVSPPPFKNLVRLIQIHQPSQLSFHSTQSKIRTLG